MNTRCSFPSRHPAARVCQGSRVADRGQSGDAVLLRQQLAAGGYTVLDGATTARVRQALVEGAADVAIIAGLPSDQAWGTCALIKRDETAFVPVILIGALPPSVCETDEAVCCWPDVALDDWPHPAELQRTLHTLLRIKQQTDSRRQQIDPDAQHFERIKARSLTVCRTS